MSQANCENTTSISEAQDETIALVARIVGACLPLLTEYKFRIPGETTDGSQKFYDEVFRAVVPTFYEFTIADAWCVFQRLDEYLLVSSDAIDRETVRGVILGLCDFLESAEPLSGADIDARLEFLTLVDIQKEHMPRIARDIQLTRGGLPAAGPHRLGDWYAATATLDVHGAEELVSSDASSPQNAEDRLTQLGAEFERLWSAEKAVIEKHDSNPTPETEAALSEASDKTNAVITQIAQTPASTMNGIRVKARALWWFWDGGDPDDELLCGSTTDCILMRSIWADLTEQRG